MNFAEVAALKLYPAPLAPTHCRQNSGSTRSGPAHPACPASRPLTKFSRAKSWTKTYMLTTSSVETWAFSLTQSSFSAFHTPPQPLSQAPSSSKGGADTMCEVNRWQLSHQYLGRNQYKYSLWLLHLLLICRMLKSNFYSWRGLFKFIFVLSVGIHTRNIIMSESRIVPENVLHWNHGFFLKTHLLHLSPVSSTL